MSYIKVVGSHYFLKLLLLYLIKLMAHSTHQSLHVALRGGGIRDLFVPPAIADALQVAQGIPDSDGPQGTAGGETKSALELGNEGEN